MFIKSTKTNPFFSLLVVIAVSLTSSGCVVSTAASVAGAAVNIAGETVGAGISVAGSAVKTTGDILVPDEKDEDKK